MPTYSVSLRKMSQCLVSLLQQKPHASARYWTWHSVLQFRVSSIKPLMQLQAADPNLITHAAKNMQRTAYTLLSKYGDIQKMRLMNQFSMSLFQLSFLIRNLVSVAWLITEGGHKIETLLWNRQRQTHWYPSTLNDTMVMVCLSQTGRQPSSRGPLPGRTVAGQILI